MENTENIEINFSMLNAEWKKITIVEDGIAKEVFVLVRKQ